MAHSKRLTSQGRVTTEARASGPTKPRRRSGTTGRGSNGGDSGYRASFTHYISGEVYYASDYGHKAWGFRV